MRLTHTKTGYVFTDKHDNNYHVMCPIAKKGGDRVIEFYVNRKKIKEISKTIPFSKTIAKMYLQNILKEFNLWNNKKEKVF